ncbi:lamina-associated polypeptide 2-like isoform X1 [Erpetoichthys calabaricus]|uniref:lamina-associated polypeptide 2-like isoform X1 n=1 Tax=Erpetoichthys calabaricus TaxID=27687 RepID=UPI002234DCC7|nr:lamina-associated polypeptide 2-like isoform X1 [Erpetoichthys calabaricus]
MSEFLQDPSVLTKDKLKSALLANDVALPPGEQKKDVYVRLYLQHLTSRNHRQSPADTFSSDEEPPAPPVGTRGRPGRKATKKTDRPLPEDNDALEMSIEELRQGLMKYGVNPGPIMPSTKKLYEKKLQKLQEQGPPESQSQAPDPKQNGSTETDQYSDKEEEEKSELILEKREPIRSRQRTPASIRPRRQDVHRIISDESTEETLIRKRPGRRLPQDQAVPSSDDNIDFSELSTTETMPSEGEAVNGGGNRSLQASMKHQAAVQETPEPQVVSRVHEIAKEPTSDILLPSVETLASPQPSETKLETSRPLQQRNKSQTIEGSHKKLSAPEATLLLNTAVLEDPVTHEPDIPKRKTRPQKISGFLSPVRAQDGEKERHDASEKLKPDLLKEMFPNEPATPTGISATCRRPIRGAASRPITISDFHLEDSRLRHSEMRYRSEVRTEMCPPKLSSPVPVASATPVRSHRFIPVWLQLLLLAIVAGFLLFVYQAMETNPSNPFMNEPPRAEEKSK